MCQISYPLEMSVSCHSLTVVGSQAATSQADTDACVDSDTQQTNGESPSPSFLPPALCLSLDFKDLALIFHPQLMQE